MAITSSNSPRSIDGILMSPSGTATQSKRPSWSLRHFQLSRLTALTLLALMAALALMTVAALTLYHYHTLNHQSANTATSDALQDIKVKVARHYVLPSDETPALATVTDKNKVQTAFFKQAENGDRILIYQRNKIAIIYRPAIDRIIAVGPVSINTPAP